MDTLLFTIVNLIKKQQLDVHFMTSKNIVSSQAHIVLKS